MAAHWTRRIVDYSRGRGLQVYRNCDVVVYRDSDVPPSAKAWSSYHELAAELYIGDNWLRDNFPIQYAMFMGSLFKFQRVGKFNQQGFIKATPWADVDPEEEEKKAQKWMARKNQPEDSISLAEKRIIERGALLKADQKAVDNHFKQLIREKRGIIL